jgi:hypothetical protein
MTRERRQRLKIFCFGVLPAAALAIDASFYVSMQGWTYSLRGSGADVFWPGVLLLGLMFFPLAAASVGYDLFHDWSTRGSARWPIVGGRVTAGSIYVAYSGLSPTRYVPLADYAYEVAGTIYRNLLPAPGLKSRMYRVLLPPGLKSREEAEEVLRSYPVGAQLRVYYDPDDPGTSVLETGDGAFRLLGLTLFFAALPFVTVSFIIAWR